MYKPMYLSHFNLISLTLAAFPVHLFIDWYSRLSFFDVCESSYCVATLRMSQGFDKSQNLPKSRVELSHTKCRHVGICHMHRNSQLVLIFTAPSRTCTCHTLADSRLSDKLLLSGRTETSEREDR